MRVGWGIDAHRLGGSPPLILGGVVVDADRGLIATSDGDVVAHAVADAILGGAGLGDLGQHFPSHDAASHGVDSLTLVAQVVEMAAEAGRRVVYVDVTVIAEHIRIAPHRQSIRESLAAAAGLDREAVSVKATTTDGMGFAGRGEGIVAMAAATVVDGPRDTI